MIPSLRFGEGWQVSLDLQIQEKRITDGPSMEPQIDDHMLKLDVGEYYEGDDNSIDREKIKVVVDLVVRKPEVSKCHRDQEELLGSSEHADEEAANFHKFQLPKFDKEMRRRKEMSLKPEISEPPDLNFDKEKRRRKEMSLKPEISVPPDLKVDKEKRRRKKMSIRPEISEPPDLKVDKEKRREEEDVFKT